MLDGKREALVIKVLQEMIRIPSIGPDEGELASFIRDFMKEMRFDAAEIDEVGNAVGKIAGTDPDLPPVLFDGHIDTMGPSTTPWDMDPFGGEIRDGRIYGRGTSDMKGSIAAALCAAAFLKQEGYKPRRDLYICGSVSEELLEGAALEPVLKRLRPGIVLIGEATNLNLAVGQRGRAEIVVETIGVPTHSSRPDLGVNAIKLMMHFVAASEKCSMPEDEILGSAVLEITDIKSFPYPGLSMVPDRCRATYDRRLLAGETEEAVLQPLRDIIKDLRGKVPGFSADLYISEAEFSTHTGYGVKAKKFAPAWVQRDKNLIDKCLRALNSAGIDAKMTTYRFCTNGSCSAGKFGIPTIGFGVGEEEQAHRVNESISVEELLLGTEGYMALFKALTS